MLNKDNENQSIKKAGIIGGLVCGLSLAGFALWGMSVADVTPFWLLRALAALTAFILGAAIGSGVGVWISETSKKRRQLEK